MKKFIIDNNSKINKNNILEIKYGKLVSKNLFDCKISKSRVSKIIKNIKEEYKCKLPKIINCIDYKVNNSIINIKKCNTKFTYNLVHYIDTDSLRILLLNKTEKKTVDNTDKYDQIVKYSKIIFNINDVFNIEIYNINDTDIYKISIIIIKPNDINLLLNNIININKLFNQ